MPKIVDHASVRDGLVEGCVRLFAERGYVSLTMREIAGALGVSTGTLYHYFPGKDALFTACVGPSRSRTSARPSSSSNCPATPRCASPPCSRTSSCTRTGSRAS